MKKILFAVLFLLFIPLFLPKFANADINAPSTLNSSGIEAGSGTQVQMKNEKVTLDISGNSYKKPVQIKNAQGGTSNFGSVTSTYLPVKVTAEFNMYNPSDSDESIDVTFPSCDYYSTSTEDCGSMSDFSVVVNGVSVSGITQIEKTIPDKLLGYTPPNPIKGTFYNWHQSFSAKSITNVKVVYTLAAKEFDVAHPPYTGAAGYYINYILSTGGSWNGNIENGEVIFNLPEKADKKYFILTSGGQESASLSAKLTETIDQDKVIVSFKNLKPSYSENLNLILFDPAEVAILNTLTTKAEKDNTFAAYVSLFKEYVKFIKAHYIFTLSGLPSGIKTLDDQLFKTFDKLIKLSKNYSELREATSIFFFDSKDVSDETIVAKIQDTCWTVVDANGNSRNADNSETCQFANNVYDLTWENALGDNSYYKSVIEELANKRLEYNSNDVLAKYLLSAMIGKTSTPSINTNNLQNQMQTTGFSIFDYIGWYDVGLFLPLLLIPVIILIRYLFAGTKKQEVIENAKRNLPTKTVAIIILIWIVLSYAITYFLFNFFAAYKSVPGDLAALGLFAVDVVLLCFAYYKYAKYKGRSKFFSLFGLPGIVFALGLYGLLILFLLPIKTPTTQLNSQQV